MPHAPLFDPTAPALLKNPYTFGGGIRLGAQLSRIEVECALDALLHRLPGFRLDDPLNPVWRPSVVFRGPARLPATWTR
jgi:cytochrome P450